MGKQIKVFGDIEIGKHKFHQRKSPILIYDVNIDKIVVSNQVPFGKNGFKYFIGYEDDSEKSMALCMMLPKMNAYGRDFDKTKYIYIYIYIYIY